MYDVVVHQITHRAVRQDVSTQLHHSMSGKSGYNARIARYQKFFVHKPEKRHQSFGDAKSRDGDTNTVADSPSAECSAQ